MLLTSPMLSLPNGGRLCDGSCVKSNCMPSQQTYVSPAHQALPSKDLRVGRADTKALTTGCPRLCPLCPNLPVLKAGNPD